MSLKSVFAGAAVAAALATCAAGAAETSAANPLLAPWTGPYGGVPAFDRMNLADLEPAMETAMANSLAAMDVIAGQGKPPTFDNTIAAMERSGEVV